MSSVVHGKKKSMQHLRIAIRLQKKLPFNFRKFYFKKYNLKEDMISKTDVELCELGTLLQNK